MRRRGLVAGGIALVAVVALAAPSDSDALERRADQEAQEQVLAWQEQDLGAYLAMRDINPEWDFMARTFVVLALANRSLDGEDHLATIDAIIADTLAVEAEGGHEYFLLSYGRQGGWVGDGRSLFVDGEIAIMMGARRVLSDDAWEAEVQQRVDRVAADLAGGALPESYPDEGWLFCHSMALAALVLHDHVSGQDHRPVIDGWLERAQRDLVDPGSGLLVSSFKTNGEWLDGPEGSSIFLAATNLQLVDPELAQRQYELARQELGSSVLGMGYAREWPESWTGPRDVDSGPIVPLIQASPSSSGFALLASAAFDDRRWHRQLVRALGAADTLIAVDPEMAAMADNAVGNAVLLYADSFGPLWAEVLGEPAES